MDPVEFTAAHGIVLVIGIIALLYMAWRFGGDDE